MNNIEKTRNRFILAYRRYRHVGLNLAADANRRSSNGKLFMSVLICVTVYAIFAFKLN